MNSHCCSVTPGSPRLPVLHSQHIPAARQLATADPQGHTWLPHEVPEGPGLGGALTNLTSTKTRMLWAMLSPPPSQGVALREKLKMLANATLRLSLSQA